MPSRINVFWNCETQDLMLCSVQDIIRTVSNGNGVLAFLSGCRARNRYHQVFPGLLLNSGIVTFHCQKLLYKIQYFYLRSAKSNSTQFDELLTEKIFQFIAYYITRSSVQY